ncbi:MAG: 23S rRNA (uracil(1939)-C(5))-methyltransferase RlmD [Candidatus Sericytochromatia bacterium]
MAGGGDAFARHDGYTLFVPYAVPGDRIRAKVISVKPGYGRALIEEVLEAGPARVVPRCPAFASCGGCQWQGLDYPGQVVWKTRLVAEALQRFGGIDPAGVLQTTIPSPEPWHYRNKVHWALSKKGKQWSIGLYEARSHQIVDAESCGIQSPLINDILAAVRIILTEFAIAPYDEATGRGWLRSIFAKAGHRTGETMLGLVTRTDDFPQRERFIATVRERLPQLTTLVQNIHPTAGNKLMGDTTLTLFGPGVIREHVGPLEFDISARSFFQVNSATIDTLYDQAAQAAGVGAGPRVVDAYCGTGSIALYLAAKGAKEVVGIEIVNSAVEDARASAARNGLSEKTRFVAGAVEEQLPQLVKEGLEADVVVLDPPRKGCDQSVLETVAAMKVPKVVYVSCDPTTLARDLKIMAGLGYRTERVQPVDMFPQTAHVESVATLVRDPR